MAALRALRRTIAVRGCHRRVCTRPSTSGEKAVAAVDELATLAGRLPVEQAELVFSYGSGAVPQAAGVDVRANMADFILAVPDVKRFHAANLRRNRHHYSAAGSLGAGALARLQSAAAPAGIYFNTLVWLPDEQRLIKYGVLSTDDLLADLLDWHCLYVAGRLQKPVIAIKAADSEPLQRALRQNLQSAVHAALLMLPDTFDDAQFYATVAGLSYMGDFRMLFGEDKDKVQKLVSGAGLHAWRDMYASTLDDMEQLVAHDGRMAQDGSVAGAYHHLNLLPKTVLAKMHLRWRQRHHLGRYCDMEEMLYALAHRRRDREVYVRHALVHITRSASLGQTAFNALTAGPVNSAKYAARKVQKMLRSLR